MSLPGKLHALHIDRTTCSRFWANQFRVLLTAGAYALMQELRQSAADTNCARAQAWSLRERFLKLGERVVASVRRIVLQLPRSFQFLAASRTRGNGTGSLALVDAPRTPKRRPSLSDQTDDRGKPRPKTTVAMRCAAHALPENSPIPPPRQFRAAILIFGDRMPRNAMLTGHSRLMQARRASCLFPA